MPEEREEDWEFSLRGMEHSRSIHESQVRVLAPKIYLRHTSRAHWAREVMGKNMHLAGAWCWGRLGKEVRDAGKIQRNRGLTRSREELEVFLLQRF